jgi:hypothetical protein
MLISSWKSLLNVKQLIKCNFMKERKKKCLLAVQGPIQFIAAYIANGWCEEKIWLEKSDITLLIYDICVPHENEILFQDTIKEISSVENFHKTIFMSELESNEISKNRYANAKSKFKKLIEVENFDYLFLATDFSSFITELILNTYPRALRIEYGDAFGLVGNKKILRVSNLQIIRNPLDFIKSILKKHVYAHYHKSFSFDLSVLTIPLVWEANYLTDKNLIIPEELFVKEIFSKISNQLIKLGNYSEQLIANSDTNCKLYLLSNLSNSGFCSFENELCLYEEIILETAVTGQRIILKNHPRASDQMLIQLKDKLSSFFEVELITDKRFSFIPIELWDVLLQNSEVFPIYSTSSISLKYLYSKQVILTLDEAKIRKYIYSDKRKALNLGVNMIGRSIKSLEDWDFKSPLWTNV